MAEVNKESNSRREKTAATRRNVLKAAKQLFSDHGYAGTTMQAIADQADVAVQTVYFVSHTHPRSRPSDPNALVWAAPKGGPLR